MKIRVRYTISEDKVLDVSPNVYLEMRANFDFARKKLGVPQFKTHIDSIEVRDYQDQAELDAYFDSKK